MTPLDHTVYPDRPAPLELKDDFERADYVQRICSALDFGVPPDSEALALLHTWKHVFDAFPLPASPAYHALRVLFGWEVVPRLPSLSDPLYVELDRQEDRSDPCETLV